MDNDPPVHHGKHLTRSTIQIQCHKATARTDARKLRNQAKPDHHMHKFAAAARLCTPYDFAFEKLAATCSQFTTSQNALI